MRSKIEAEEGFIAGSGPSGSEDAEEEASLYVDDGAYAEAGRACNDGGVGEGVERATLSCCGEGTTTSRGKDGHPIRGWG